MVQDQVAYYSSAFQDREASLKQANYDYFQKQENQKFINHRQSSLANNNSAQLRHSKTVDSEQHLLNLSFLKRLKSEGKPVVLTKSYTKLLNITDDLDDAIQADLQSSSDNNDKTKK